MGQLAQWKPESYREAVDWWLWSILLQVSDPEFDFVVAELWSEGTAGLVEEEAGLRAFFEERSAFDRAKELLRDHVVETREESEPAQGPPQSDSWDPILIGNQFFVSPAEAAVPPGRFRLNIFATTAFGTGRHESTQVCIQALEKWLRPGDIVLDVGCGSGILSMAARYLGASGVISCDIDADAIATAKQHIDTPLFQGSADALRDGFADITVANLTAPILDGLSGEFRRVTKPGGLLLAGGFLEDAPPHHLEPAEMLELNGWLCWICRYRG